MPTWVDQQTDPKKLASPRRIQVIKDAKEALAVMGLNWGILVTRDSTSDGYRITAGPHASVPPGEIHEVDRDAR